MKKLFLTLITVFLVCVGSPSWSADGDRVIEGIRADTIDTVDLDATGNIQAATYGSGANPIPDATLLGIDDGTTSQILVGGGANTKPEWGTDLPTAVTIGTKYIYRADGTDVPVADGGTGASTLTDGGVLLGSGTGAVTPMAVLTDGQIIVGDGTTDPVAESGDTARISLGVGSTDSPTFAGITSNGVLTVKPDGTNEVLQINDGSLDLSDGNAGAVGTLTVDASGNLSHNKNISAVDLDGIIGSNTPAAGTFTTFTSNGIDDNATGEILQITDAGVTVAGDLSATDIDGIIGSNTPAAIAGTTVTASGTISVDDTTDSTSTTTGSVHTDGGLGVAKKSFFGDDVDFGGNIYMRGAQSYKKTNVADTAYGTSALTSDYIVAYSSLSAARAAVISTEDVQSGSATQPRIMVIKDQSGNAGTYNITVSLESGLIDGNATRTINVPYGSVTIYLDGTNGFIVD